MTETGVPLVVDPGLGVPAVTAALLDARGWAGNPSYAGIAHAIEQARRERGLTQAQARINRATVYDCFRVGRTRLDPRLVLEIAAALGVSGPDLAQWRHAVRRSLLPESGRPPVTVTIGLPTQRERAVGRSVLIASIVRRLETGRRAVALEGMAGVGKTTLATAVAAELVRRDATRTVVHIDMHGYAPQAAAPEIDTVLEAVIRAAWPDEPAAVTPAEDRGVSPARVAVERRDDHRQRDVGVGCSRVAATPREWADGGDESVPAARHTGNDVRGAGWPRRGGCGGHPPTGQRTRRRLWRARRPERVGGASATGRAARRTPAGRASGLEGSQTTSLPCGTSRTASNSPAR